MYKYFLSHSSKDKAVVRQFAVGLGEGDCFLDERAMHPGDDLFDRIDNAIAAAGVFVLFWSNASASSAWVKEEVAQARLRRLRGDDIRIIPVLLDNAAIPNWMQRIVYTELARGLEAAVADIQRAQSESFGPVAGAKRNVIDATFHDRVDEADQLENAYRSAGTSCIVLSGLPGMGKTALLRNVFQTRLPQLRPIWIDCETASTPSTFFAFLAKRLGLALPEAILTSGDWAAYWRSWVAPILDATTDTVVLDNAHAILGEDGKLPWWVTSLVRALGSVPGPDHLSLVLTTSRPIEFPPGLVTDPWYAKLSQLPHDDVIRTLRVRLAQVHPRRNASQEQLALAARIVAGYPIGAQLWAAHAARVGVELALLDPAPVNRQVRELVADILAKSQLSPQEQSGLLVLSLLRFPVTAQRLIKDLGIPATTVTKLQESMLLDESLDGLAVHSLLSKYISENISANVDVRSAHEKLGAFFKSQWQALPTNTPESALCGSQAYYHLVSAGKVEEAKVVRWSLAEETRNAVQGLYHRKQDSTIIELVERLVSTVGDVLDSQVRFYYAMAMGHSADSEPKRQKVLSEFSILLTENPTHRYYWSALGDAHARWGNFAEAKEAYIKARLHGRKDDPVPSQRLGELLLKHGHPGEAGPFFEEAKTIAPGDPRVLAAYASWLYQMNRTDEALTLVRDGIHRWPEDVQLRHRAGQILKKQGRSQEAIEHLSRAAVGWTSPASYVSLADLYLELGDVDAAERTIAKFPGAKSGGCYSILGNIARKRQRFTEAAQHYERALKLEGPSVRVYGSIAQLAQDRAEAAAENLAFAAAEAYLAEGAYSIEQGLTIEPGNEILTTLRREGAAIQARLVARRRKANG